MKKSNISPIQNYRKHAKITGFLGKKGIIEQTTKLANPNNKQFYSGLVALVKINDSHDSNEIKITVPVHSEDQENINIGDNVILSLRLESINTAELRNYGLVARKIYE